MTQPKNPYKYRGIQLPKVWEQGYAAGLADGEKRLARAFKRWMSTEAKVHPGAQVSLFTCSIDDWLSTRAKRRKK